MKNPCLRPRPATAHWVRSLPQNSASPIRAGASECWDDSDGYVGVGMVASDDCRWRRSIPRLVSHQRLGLYITPDRVADSGGVFSEVWLAPRAERNLAAHQLVWPLFSKLD